MNVSNFIDTKFLALIDHLINTISGGTAVLKKVCGQDVQKYIIKAKLPSTQVEFITIELF